MNRNNADIRKSENQSKFIQDRISQVEKHFGDLCSEFGGLARKLSKLRDRGDGVSKVLMQYAENENLNPTTKESIVEFAENLSLIQDYRDTQVKRIEGKVVDPLTLYGQNCKHAKGDLKKAFEARDKEVKTQKKLENVRDKNPSDRHQISQQAETELQKASVDASWTSKALEERMDGFEKKKLQDIKSVLLEFVNIEMVFHVRALETYTKCFKSLQKMDEEEDLEMFRNSLRPNNTQTRLDMQRASSTRSLNTNNAPSNHTPQQQRRHSDTPAPRVASNQRGMYSMQQDDDDDDEYEDETDDDEYETQFNNQQRQQPSSQQQQKQQQQRSMPQPQSRRK